MARHASRYRSSVGPRGDGVGAARPYHAYLFANQRANRMKVLVHDGIGVRLAARRLNSGKLAWPKDVSGTLTLNGPQFGALVLGRLATHRKKPA